MFFDLLNHRYLFATRFSMGVFIPDYDAIGLHLCIWHGDARQVGY